MGCGASTPVKPIASGDPPVRAQQTSSSGSDADAKENGQPARTAVSAEPAAALAAGEAGAPSTGAPAAAADDDDFPAAPQKPRGAAAGVRRGSDLVMPFTESAFGASAEVKLREDDGPPVLNDAPRAEDGEKETGSGAFGAFAQEAESFGAFGLGAVVRRSENEGGGEEGEPNIAMGMLLRALEANDYVSVQRMLEHTPADIYSKLPDGNSLLTRACQLQFEQVARNSGAILAQFWRNSGAILRNYISLPTSPHLVLSRSAACSSARRPTCCTPTTRARRRSSSRAPQRRRGESWRRRLGRRRRHIG